MKKPLLSLAAASLLAGALVAAPAVAAPRQYVVIVAEGLNPQILEMGKNYLRKADEEPEANTAFDMLKEQGKPASVPLDALSQMKGLLETAEKNGFQTGLVTTGDVTKIAPLFYDVTGDVADFLTGDNAKYEFIGGAGRANFKPEQTAKIKAMGGTYLPDEDAFDGEIKGRALALQNENSLSYALDRDPIVEAGLAEMGSAAMDVLSAENQPFVLVIHDDLVKKALQTKDTPALLEQYRELNAILTDALGRQEDDPQLAVAALMTGGSVVPKFTTTDQAEQDDAFFVASNLSMSFTGASRFLTDATDDKIRIFIDPEEGVYRGWKLSDADRAKIIAGNLMPETAIRAAYEPVFKIEYAAETTTPMAYTVGFDATGGLIEALQKAISTKPDK